MIPVKYKKSKLKRKARGFDKYESTVLFSAYDKANTIVNNIHTKLAEVGTLDELGTVAISSETLLLISTALVEAYIKLHKEDLLREGIYYNFTNTIH